MAIDLSVRNLSWGPHRSRRIIDDISFDAPAGSVTVIVGPNGAGKSTLLRSIYRQNRPSAGLVLAGGRDVWQIPVAEVSRLIAAVLQEAAPDFSFTVREIVAMGRIPYRKGVFAGQSRADRTIIEQVLHEFQLTDFAARPFNQLSGGEKQRAMIARAMVQQPSLLILDEPTNHLDIRHQLDILALLRRLGLTVLITLHDLNLAASLADQVLVMHQGRLAAFGATADVLTSRTIRSVFDVDAHVGRDASGAPRFEFQLPT